MEGPLARAPPTADDRLADETAGLLATGLLATGLLAAGLLATGLLATGLLAARLLAARLNTYCMTSVLSSHSHVGLSNLHESVPCCKLRVLAFEW